MSARALPLVAAIVAGTAIAGCDISQSARTGPVDELTESDAPFARPLGELVVDDVPDGLRTTFDVECLGAAYILGFGLDQLVVPGADPANLTPESFVTDGPTDVDADALIGGIEQCGDVRVYALVVGGTRWAQEPLTEQQLRCAAGRIDRARGSELLRASVVVEATVDEVARDEATREIVDLLRECGAPMTDLP